MKVEIPKKYQNAVDAYNTIDEAEEMAALVMEETGFVTETKVDDDNGCAVVLLTKRAVSDIDYDKYITNGEIKFDDDGELYVLGTDEENAIDWVKAVSVSEITIDCSVPFGEIKEPAIIKELNKQEEQNGIPLCANMFQMKGKSNHLLMVTYPCYTGVTVDGEPLEVGDKLYAPNNSQITVVKKVVNYRVLENTFYNYDDIRRINPVYLDSLGNEIPAEVKKTLWSKKERKDSKEYRQEQSEKHLEIASEIGAVVLGFAGIIGIVVLVVCGVRGYQKAAQSVQQQTAEAAQEEVVVIGEQEQEVEEKEEQAEEQAEEQEEEQKEEKEQEATPVNESIVVTIKDKSYSIFFNEATITLADKNGVEMTFQYNMSYKANIGDEGMQIPVIKHHNADGTTTIMFTGDDGQNHAFTRIK